MHFIFSFIWKMLCLCVWYLIAFKGRLKDAVFILDVLKDGGECY